MGHNVTIVASSLSHLRVCQPIIHGALTTEKVDGLNYVWIKGIKYLGNGFGRLLNMMFLFGLFILQKYIGRTQTHVDRFKHLSYDNSRDMLANSCDARLVFELHDAGLNRSQKLQAI